MCYAQNMLALKRVPSAHDTCLRDFEEARTTLVSEK